MKMPVLFVGHGNPMNAIERNAFHLGWSAVAKRLPRPKSVLCVSAHWETRGAWVTAAARPATIHDFYGFPRALFDVRYPAPGDPALAARVAALVSSERVHLDPDRGLDHGAWSVLIAMYPEADVPVVQLGMDTSLPGGHHYALARQLAALRDEGVLVLGSGNFVHNLRPSTSGTRRRSTGRSRPMPRSAATWRPAATASWRTTHHAPKRGSPCRLPSTTCRSCTRLHCNNPMKEPNFSMSRCPARSR